MPRRPKHPDQLKGHSHGRAGAAADRRAGMQTYTAESVPQPSLIDLVGAINPMTDEQFFPQTLDFWRNLGQFPTIAAGLQAAQWDMLARAIMVDDASLSDPKWAAEARQRFTQFGITPDDMLKQRIQIVAADEAEERRKQGKEPPAGNTSRNRRGPLTAVK